MLDFQLHYWTMPPLSISILAPLNKELLLHLGYFCYSLRICFTKLFISLGIYRPRKSSLFLYLALLEHTEAVLERMAFIWVAEGEEEAEKAVLKVLLIY